MDSPAGVLSDQVWSQIYRAIASEKPGQFVYQGLVTGRDETARVVWVQELSSDPIEVVGQAHEITYYAGTQRKVTTVPPAVPEMGDTVLVIRTINDKFKCIGVLQSTARWSDNGSIAQLKLADIPPGANGQFLETQAGVAVWADFTPSTGTAASFSQTIGDGSTTIFTITHNLNIADCMVQVREVGGDQSFVFPEMRKVDNNTVRIVFDVAPTTNQYRVLVTGGTFTLLGGTAGGDLSGTYPNPDIAAGVVGVGELGIFPMHRIYDNTFGAGLTTLDTGVFTVPAGAVGLRIAYNVLTASGAAVSFQGRFNNNSTAAYNYFAWSESTSLGFDVQNVDGTTNFRAGVCDSSNYGSGFIEIPFANTSIARKYFRIHSMHATSTERESSGYFESGGSAITRLQLICGTAFAAGGRITVWAV